MSDATTATIDASGISAPAYADILTYLQNQFQTIYGSDIYLEPDSQDGQLIGILALAISNANAMAISVFNQFSPATSYGAGLSSVVKINGIARLVSSNSVVDVNVGGQAGTQITNGIATDAAGNRWDLPALVTIPPAGVITVTAVCETSGAIQAAPNTVTGIGSPTRGWQTVTNAFAATPGAPVETDGQLRIRQAVSTAIPSRTVLEGIVGAIYAITHVLRVAPYENDTSFPDANGIPAHSIALVVDGGDDTEIANAIAVKKSPGAGTVGTTSITVTDTYGIPHVINFYRPTVVSVQVTVTIKAFANYNSAIGQQIVNAITSYMLPIGANVLLTKLYSPANLDGTPGGATFDILNIVLGRNGAPQFSGNVPIAFNEAPLITAADVTLIVT